MTSKSANQTMARAVGLPMQSTNRWGRLKDIKLDTLESFGLPSKGDKR